MYRTKKEVDKYVDNLLNKLSDKEFKTRSYSIGRLYYEVGDYASCQRFVEQYLTQKDNNAAAHKLLGQALQKLGLKENALEQYKTSLDIDPTQTSLILDICELLVDDVIIDPSYAKYWCEKAEAIFPRHPVTFRLTERLISVTNPDPEAVIKLLKSELALRPREAQLHARLLRHYLDNNKIKEAFDHSFNVEFGDKPFANNYSWYETVAEILNHNGHITSDWKYQLLLLTVKERLCALSLTEIPLGTSKSLVESNDLLCEYDKANSVVAKCGPCLGFGEFHTTLLNHHRGQFALHAATYILKKAKKDQVSWNDATKIAAPLMLIAWHTEPLNYNENWLSQLPETQKNAVDLWYVEGSYRCSQSGHYLLRNAQDKNQSYLDKISQNCSGNHWKDKLIEIFFSRGQSHKLQLSYFASDAFQCPTLRLPRKSDVETYDCNAQKEYKNSLHHFVWTILNYNNFGHFKCQLFKTLTPKIQNFTNCGPETLNKLDVHAFLYAVALTTQQNLLKLSTPITATGKPCVLPANITDLLCSLTQMKWWDCAYKFVQNEFGSELTDIRLTLSRGIEVVRCIDNHGLDPDLLCSLGRIFSEQAKHTTSVDEKLCLEERAQLYYLSAIPLLEKLQSKTLIKFPEKRIFDFNNKDLSTKEINSLLEECKLYVAVTYIDNGEYEKVTQILSNLKSPQAYYHLSETYKKMALQDKGLSRNTQDIDSRSVYASLLSKAKNYAYKSIDILKNSGLNKHHKLYSAAQEQIDELETLLNKIDNNYLHDNGEDGRYSSDENASLVGNVSIPLHMNSTVFRSISSTPKQPTSLLNMTNYRSAVDTHTFETTKNDQQFLERIETQIKNLQKREVSINDFMHQTKDWFEDNQKLGNKIMSTINTNIQNTTDQFRTLKISIDQVKDQINECRNECKDVGELKKQIADLQKEVKKLKKTSSEQTIDESELYNIDDEYRQNESTTNFGTQLPFAPQQVIPPFNQRFAAPFPIPPNPYLYNPNFYNLYSQLMQPTSVAGAQSFFDNNRTPVNYPGIYPTPDQMYLDVANLVPPVVPTSTVPTIPSVPTPAMASLPMTTIPTSTPLTKNITHRDPQDHSRNLPVNVVITSSDPLPTYSSTQTPVLSVTIPSKHIKGTPHNYQIPMPSTTDNSFKAQPFSFSTSVSKTLTNWNKSSVFDESNVYIASPLISDKNTKITDSVASPLTFDKNTKSPGDSLCTSVNTTLNKSRTLSERSNTSAENYDPCPDFKPIIPLPAEVKVTTGEEDETVVFSSRAKLFRFVDKEWKERGIGEMKLLRHKLTGKVRILMRREQIHKICANHIITNEMEITPMKNETKAYFWVANDFAEETVVLEKFCIRFKTSEIAQQFYESFERARNEASSIISQTNIDVNPLPTPKTNTLNKPTEAKNDQETNSVKAVLGGFTFSSTPSFKSVSDTSKTSQHSTQETSSKVNIFSNFNFKSTTTSTLSNLFGPSDEKPVGNKMSSMQKPDNKFDNSDVVEEFEPNVEFKPVVPLPALIDQKTGEEDELVLFEHRAKLLRFEAERKEWKERGLGNIKLLVHKDNCQKLRLLMRREQVMKVCCNHTITKDMVFEKMSNIDKAVTWCAKDFSEGELIPETFCLRFKTAQVCSEFIDAIKLAQSKMKVDLKSVKEGQNAAKQNNNGFGDKFKTKPGSWNCNGCFTNNLENFSKCACCEQVKPSTKPEPTNNTGDKLIAAPVTQWGAQFKPKSGTWECTQCFVRNEGDVANCVACNSPKDLSINDSNKSNNTSDPKNVVALLAPQIPKWGSQFQPKAGTWECTQCLVRNEGNAVSCIACNNLKNGDAIKDTKSVFTSETKFKFGIEPKVSDTKNSKSDTFSIFDGTGEHKFRFGIPPSENNKLGVVSFWGQTPATVDNSAKTTVEMKHSLHVPTSPINFNLKSNELNITALKPGLLPTPKTETDSVIGKEGTTFDFVFKPKTPIKGKSPVKSPKTDKGDESEDNEYASEDEGHHIHFNPVIPLPDKVEVVTGEENEDEIYGHRAKLYRFTAGQWKERGIGVVKVLKHKQNGKVRVVMRREQVLKICLNHALTPEITYTPKDEKTWLFAANDFSEGELSLQQFCLRFKNKDIAEKFKNAIDALRNGSAVSESKNDDNDVIFVKEIQASKDEQAKAKELMLPENFFTYKTKPPCEGCRGCYDSDESNITNTDFKVKFPILSSVSTPIKSFTPPTYQSPTTSLYGTPANFNKSSDSTVFRTPLESPQNFQQKFHNTEENSPVAIKNSVLAAPKLFTPKESAEADVKSIFAIAQDKAKSNNSGSVFGGMSTNKSIFELPEAKQQNLAGQTVFVADPKQKTFNVFSGTNSNVFGIPSADQKSGLNESKQPNPPSTGIFGQTLQSSGLFGNMQKTNKNIFGTTQPAPNSGNTSQKTLNWNIPTKELYSNDSSKEKKPEDKKQDTDTNKESVFKVDSSLSFAALSSSGPGFEIQTTPDFKWQGAGQQLFNSTSKPKDPDSSAKESTVVEVEAEAVGEEEYDPHYEPIVPLPDKIVVTTGEEDEQKIFGERGKLYRYDEQTHEWKERGVGEIKILYHPQRTSYRLLLRREQVHKAVLNMLLFNDFELLPMKSSDRAWTWAGRNFAENTAGEQETLAIRFKTVALATEFKDKVIECVRKLQAAAAASIRQAKDETDSVEKFNSVPKLRLPKHLESSARADESIATSSNIEKQNGDSVPPVQPVAEIFKQIHFQEVEEDNGPHEEEYDNDYDHNEDYEDYYNEEEEEESAIYYACEGKVLVEQGQTQTSCDEAQVQVLYDQDIYSPKILVTDSNTGEILADMLIHTETEFQMSGESCTWSGVDYTSNDPVDKTVTVHFDDADTAMQFYDSCETSKAATYSSTDPDS